MKRAEEAAVFALRRRRERWIEIFIDGTQSIGLFFLLSSTPVDERIFFYSFIELNKILFSSK